LLQFMESWAAQPAVEFLGRSLVHFLWQGSVVALLLAVLLYALRGATANVRYRLACAALLVMAACPVATLAWLGSLAAPPPHLAGPQVAEGAPADGGREPSPIDMTSGSAPSRPFPEASPAGQMPAAPFGPSAGPPPTRPGLGVMRSLLPWFVLA